MTQRSITVRETGWRGSPVDDVTDLTAAAAKHFWRNAKTECQRGVHTPTVRTDEPTKRKCVCGILTAEKAEWAEELPVATGLGIVITNDRSGPGFSGIPFWESGWPKQKSPTP